MTEAFEAQKLREALAPHLNRRQAALKMGISRGYLRDLEVGDREWTPHRRADFLRVLSEWQANPKPAPRKQRNDIGKKRRRWRRRSRAEIEAARALVPVPHSHGEIVGIG